MRKKRRRHRNWHSSASTAAPITNATSKTTRCNRHTSTTTRNQRLFSELPHATTRDTDPQRKSDGCKVRLNSFFVVIFCYNSFFIDPQTAKSISVNNKRVMDKTTTGTVKRTKVSQQQSLQQSPQQQQQFLQ